MKEELPQGDFHIQEERRLFYVALTRAQERLTLTTRHGEEEQSSRVHRRYRDGTGDQAPRRFACPLPK